MKPTPSSIFGGCFAFRGWLNTNKKSFGGAPHFHPLGVVLFGFGIFFSMLPHAVPFFISRVHLFTKTP